ncbi:MAG TPA: tol-pal system protein YbgF [Thermoanaerobaculia bacterium]|nr:tol-pal system protein YbgF [Thermoanaerobaculia bacterium]
MKNLAVLAVLMLSAACTSTMDDDGPEPVTAPQAVTDPALTQSVNAMQTQLTELLERMDVMNSRLAQVESGAVAAPAAVAAAPVTAPARARTQSVPQAATPQTPDTRNQSPAEPPQRAVVGAALAESYRQAIMLFGRGRHSEARRGFEAVFEADSGGDLADNALFWIGETYFAAGDLNNAVRYYTRVVNEYADQNKAPDAMFKTALAQAKTGDLALARRTLQQVIERYPYSSTASSAKAELQRIKY